MSSRVRLARVFKALRDRRAGFYALCDAFELEATSLWRGYDPRREPPRIPARW